MTSAATTTTTQPAGCFDENRRADSNWQVNKSLAECNQALFENKDAADVTFSIEYENGPSKDSPVKISAHKLILLSRSPVFHAMFCGEIPFTEPEIKVEDVDPGAFKEILRYMYYDKAHITPSNVLYITYATKKYMLPALTNLCVQYLERDLSSSNVCLILEHSIFFSEDDLIQKALEVVQANTVEVLETSAFGKLSSAALGRILDLENVTADEVDIFAACMDWASGECERQKLEDSEENQRKVLGDYLYKIRFPAMTIRQFADIVVPAGILTDQEGFQMFQYFVCEIKPDLGKFQTKARTTKRKPGRLMIPGPYSLKSVAFGYQATVDLYCLVTKDIKIQYLYLHDFNRTGYEYSKFELNIVQEQVVKGSYTNGENDTEMLTLEGNAVSRLPMNNTMIKAGKFKIHIDHWVCRFKIPNIPNVKEEHNIQFCESDKPFVTTDKIVSMKIGSQKEMPLLALEYWMV